MADLCKGDKATGVEFVALVHVDTAEGCFDVGHGGDAIERPDRGRFRHSPGHSEASLLSSVIGRLVFGCYLCSRVVGAVGEGELRL